MNKRKWILLIVTALLVWGWYKLFYKTWDNEGVAKDADCIMVLDVKRITNTVIWQFITTPSQWKGISLSSGEGKVKWDEMVKLPDYVFIFHKTGQPANALYTVVEINNKEDFAKGLVQHHFEKMGDGYYSSRETGIELIQNGNKLLIGNAAVEDKKLMQQTAEGLFNKKQFVVKDILEKNVSTKNHFSLQFLNVDASAEQFVTAGFDKQSIFIDASLELTKGTSFPTHTFSYNDTSLLSLGFTQPQPSIKNLLADSARASISRALNFNIDSVFLAGNQLYQLDVGGIYARVDSAVSYTYDDNFSAVENVVVNNVEEPAFNFTMQGKAANDIFNYWQQNGKVEKTAAGYWFTPVPFVKSYCSVGNEKLAITANRYTTTAASKSFEGIFFLKLLLSKIPASLQKYIPPAITKALNNIESIEAKAVNDKQIINVQIILLKKKNDLPVMEL